MKALRYFLTIAAITAAATTSAQTIDMNAVADFSPSTQCRVFEICRHTNLQPSQQVQIAHMVESQDSIMAARLKADGGVLTVKSRNAVDRFRANQLKQLLSDDQLQQYYRGIYDAEASAEANAITNTLQKKYNLTDQNGKFIRVAFYKIGLESRVIKKLMADKPKAANAKIAKLRQHYIQTIEDKGGIRVDPEAMTVEVIRPFRPNNLNLD